MLAAWSQHPGFFIFQSFVFLAILSLAGYVFLKNRTFRHKERLQFLQSGPRGTELFFSSKLLSYIPWQFWTSLGILLLIILCYFISFYINKDSTSTATFLDLIKTVTGAVIGSLFGKSLKQTNNTPTNKQ